MGKAVKGENWPLYSIMEPNLVLLSLRFKGSNGNVVLLMWVNSVVSQIREGKTEEKRWKSGLVVHSFPIDFGEKISSVDGTWCESESEQSFDKENFPNSFYFLNLMICLSCSLLRSGSRLLMARYLRLTLLAYFFLRPIRINNIHQCLKEIYEPIICFRGRHAFIFRCVGRRYIAFILNPFRYMCFRPLSRFHSLCFTLKDANLS